MPGWPPPRPFSNSFAPSTTKRSLHGDPDGSRARALAGGAALQGPFSGCGELRRREFACENQDLPVAVCERQAAVFYPFRSSRARGRRGSRKSARCAARIFRRGLRRRDRRGRALGSRRAAAFRAGPATAAARRSLDDVLVAIGAPEVWASGNLGGGATIAVVDTGVSGGRRELAPERRAGAWQPAGTPPFSDPVGHGTMCAVIAAGSKAGGGRFRRGGAGGAGPRLRDPLLRQRAGGDLRLPDRPPGAGSGVAPGGDQQLRPPLRRSAFLLRRQAAISSWRWRRRSPRARPCSSRRATTTSWPAAGRSIATRARSSATSCGATS